MRSLLLHTSNFESEIVIASNRPKGIISEENKSPFKKMKNCLTVLFCLEIEDGEEQVEKIYKEIIANAQQINVKNIMIVPFIHLSNKIAPPETAKRLYKILLEKLLCTQLNIDYSHFGYAKKFLLDIKGHRLAYKYREFY